MTLMLLTATACGAHTNYRASTELKDLMAQREELFQRPLRCWPEDDEVVRSKLIGQNRLTASDVKANDTTLRYVYMCMVCPLYTEEGELRESRCYNSIIGLNKAGKIVAEY